ncbi:DNA polymerase V [Klebsiella michiganensis]|uniref:DNA polymerase V n=1 Tax=Klebsiella michiganensis TaxID=1134687 RepID=UPI0012B7823D|nr:DNA polymerase V [Klebsiella michiganensis]
MPRLYEIETACRKAIDILPNGKRILTTRRFLQELERYNWHWSPRQANQWIERNQTYFVDKTTDGNENRLWMLRNMGRVL